MTLCMYTHSWLSGLNHWFNRPVCVSYRQQTTCSSFIYCSCRSTWVHCSSPKRSVDGWSSLLLQLHTECCQPSCWHCVNRSGWVTCHYWWHCHSDRQCPHHPLSAEEPQWELLLHCNQHTWECCHLQQPPGSRYVCMVMIPLTYGNCACTYSSRTLG